MAASQFNARPQLTFAINGLAGIPDGSQGRSPPSPLGSQRKMREKCWEKDEGEKETRPSQVLKTTFKREMDKLVEQERNSVVFSELPRPCTNKLRDSWLNFLAKVCACVTPVCLHGTYAKGSWWFLAFSHLQTHNGPWWLAKWFVTYLQDNYWIVYCARRVVVQYSM